MGSRAIGVTAITIDLIAVVAGLVLLNDTVAAVSSWLCRFGADCSTYGTRHVRFGVDGKYVLIHLTDVTQLIELAV